MTDKQRDAFWALVREVGIVRLFVVLSACGSLLLTTGAFIGSGTVRSIAQENSQAIGVEQGVNIRQDTAIARLQAREVSWSMDLAEIRLTTCLTLMEVREDPNTDRCRPGRAP